MKPVIDFIREQINMNFEEKIITHYEMSDGRFWSIKNAAFVDSLPDGAVSGLCGASKKDSTVENLISTLESYGFNKGELKTDVEYAAEVRAERDRLLAQTDYLAMPDYPLGEDRKAAVFAYRQALRDVPKQAGFPRQISWPSKP